MTIDWSRIRPIRHVMTVKQIIRGLTEEEILEVAQQLDIPATNRAMARQLIVDHCKERKINVWKLSEMFPCVQALLPVHRLE